MVPNMGDVKCRKTIHIGITRLAELKENIV